MTQIRVFVASPGDVSEERDIASHVVGEINRVFGSSFGVQLEAVRWETHASPDVGSDAQDVINRQVGEFDILVGVMWRRFGSPTRRARSGTGEEFERAYRSFKDHGRPRIMFYFRTSPFYTPDLSALAQFRKVAEFRKKLEKLGVLYWTYQTPLEFERNVREHLTRRVLEIVDRLGKAKPAREAPEYRGPVAPVKAQSIFLAYGHHDRDAARSIYALLRGAGFPVWMDEQDLLPGQFWHGEVDKAIQRSDLTVVLVSANVDPDKGFWSKELEIILRKSNERGGRTIIPVRLDRSKPPDSLRHLQWVDYFEPDGPERLVQTIDRITC
jgi:hypothetical protein